MRLPRGAVSDCLGVIAVAALVAFALEPWQDTPFVDDWAYAWSVETLLHQGRLAILDWSSHANFAQILWGALFCLPAGFSFVALRASTWVAATACVAGLYLLLRELDCPRRDALLGAAALAAHPIFFMLSATFMTDVPFLAALTWASLAFVHALHRRSDRALVAAALAACVAIATRAVGVVLPLAMALTLLRHGDAWGRRPARLALAAAPLAFAALLLWSLPAHVEHVADLTGLADAPVRRMENLRFALPLLGMMAPRTIAYAAAGCGLALAPLAIGGLRPRRRRPGDDEDERARGRGDGRTRVAIAALAVLVILWLMTLALGVADPPPLSDGATWALGELGATEPLVPGHRPPPVPGWIGGVLTLLGFASAGALFARAASAPARPSPGAVFLRWSLIVYLGLMATLWLQYDRYILPLLVPAMALVLAAGPLPRPRLTLACVALMAVLAVVGTRDHLTYNGALWRAVVALRTSGVPAHDIDGGYVVNGWALYAHPDDAVRDERGQPLVPGLNVAEGPARYRIANAPVPGFTVVDHLPYRRWLGRSGALYVLERNAAPSGDAAAGQPAHETPRSPW